MKRMTAIALALVAGFAFSARADDDAYKNRPATTDRTAASDRVNDSSDAAKMRKGEAKRHIWTSDVALEQAKIGMQGLYALVDDNEGAFDQDHAQALLKNVEHGVTMAAQHLQHLASLPAKDKDAQTDLTKAQTSIARVQSALKSLDAPIRSGMIRGSGGDVGPVDKSASNDRKMTGTASTDQNNTLRGDIKNAWKALDDADKDFKKVAGDFGVSTRLPKP